MENKMVASKEMVNAYIEAALWSTCDENDTPFDAYKDASDLCPDALRYAQDTCSDFLQCVADDDIKVDLDDAAMGHNLWLTAQRHGSGFWDLGIGQTGALLTTVAHNFHADLYVGDDGMLHFG